MIVRNRARSSRKSEEEVFAPKRLGRAAVAVLAGVAGAESQCPGVAEVLAWVPKRALWMAAASVAVAALVEAEAVVVLAKATLEALAPIQVPIVLTLVLVLQVTEMPIAGSILTTRMAGVRVVVPALAVPMAAGLVETETRARTESSPMKSALFRNRRHWRFLRLALSVSSSRVKVAGSNQDKYRKFSRKLELSVDADVY
nr:hypothetical protein [Nitrosospira briensis]